MCDLDCEDCVIVIGVIWGDAFNQLAIAYFCSYAMRHLAVWATALTLQRLTSGELFVRFCLILWSMVPMSSASES